MKALSGKKLLLIILVMGIVLMGSGFGYALTAHVLPGTGLDTYHRNFGLWTVTNQSEFNAGVLNNVDINSSPGDVKIAPSSNWLAGYNYRKTFTVDNQEAATNLSTYQMLLYVANESSKTGFTTSAKFPGTVTTTSSSPYDDDTWVNYNNVKADDATYSYITTSNFDSPDYSYQLRCSNFGFNLPSGSVVTGISVEVDCYYASGQGAGKDTLVQLTKTNSALVGSNRAFNNHNWLTSATVSTYGSSEDLWGTTWSEAEVEASTFGVWVGVQATAANADVYIDYVRITVHYYTGTTTTDSGKYVDLDGLSLSWPNDIRFTTSDGTTLLDYWIEESDTVDGKWWVEFDSLPYATDATFYIYWGKASDAGASNGSNTFVFFDDFNSFNDAVWSKTEVGGTVSFSGSVVTLDNTNAGSTVSLYTDNAYGTKPFIIETKYQRPGYYRNRMYDTTSAGGGSPTGYDYGDFGEVALFWNGASVTTMVNNTYYIVQWVDTASDYRWNILDTQYWTLFSRAKGSTVANTGYVSFLGTESTSSDLKLDWIRFRKTTTTEPIFKTWGTRGTEETVYPVAWYNASWSKRAPVTISNGGSALTDYQVLVNVTYDADMQSNFNDIRFTSSDGITLLPHWCESYASGVSAVFWVNVSLVTSGSSTIYMYYGNSGASAGSSYDSTFTKNFGESGLAALWHMDEGSGITTADSSGNGNTGNLIGGLSWNGSDGGQWDGRSEVSFSTGNCLNFDGSQTKYVNVSDSSSLSFTNAITIEAWVKPTWTVYPDWTMVYIDWDDPGGSNNSVHFSLYNGKVSLYISSTGADAANLDGSTILTLNKSYHIAATFDSGTFNVYLNGSKDATQYVSGTVTSIFNSPYTKTIGVKNNAAHEKPFKGPIDEVRIYNRALSQDEIQRHYIRSKYANPGPTTSMGTEISYSISTIASDVCNTGHAGAGWDLLGWSNSSVSGTSITFEVRASNTSFLKGDSTPAWQPYSVIPTINGTYHQWRATLNTFNGSVTPLLNEVRDLYSW